MLVEGGQPVSEETLRRWAKRSNLFLHPEAAFLIKTQTMGMGVFARRTIGKGQTIISCPHAAYIAPMDETVDNAPSAAVLGSFRDESGARLDDWSRTVLRLLAEVLRKDSPWRFWLQCCPKMSDYVFDAQIPENGHAPTASPMIFGLPPSYRLHDEEQRVLSGPAQQVADLNVFSKMQQALQVIKKHPEIFPESPDMMTLFLECAAQVTSRGFHRESLERPGPFLLPVIDFLNHNSERCNVEFVIHGGGGRKHVTFDVIATKDIQPKEQIFHNYGSLSAARFFVEFQFVQHQRALEQDQSIRWSPTALADAMSVCLERNDFSRRNELRTRLRTRAKYLVDHDLLFEEGVMLTGGNTPGEHTVGSVAPDADHAEALAERQEAEIRVLESTLFLMVIDEEAFKAIGGYLSRYWEPSHLVSKRSEYSDTEAGSCVLRALGASSYLKVPTEALKSASSLSNFVTLAITLPFLTLSQDTISFQMGLPASDSGIRSLKAQGMLRQVLGHELTLINRLIDDLKREMVKRSS